MVILNVTNRFLSVVTLLLIMMNSWQVYGAINKEECETKKGGVWCPGESNCVVRSDVKVKTSSEAQKVCSDLGGDLPDFTWEMMAQLTDCFNGTPYKTPYIIFLKSAHKEHKCASLVAPSEGIQETKFLYDECELKDKEASVLCHIHI